MAQATEQDHRDQHNYTGQFNMFDIDAIADYGVRTNVIRWIEDLKSGNYCQVEGALVQYNTDQQQMGYCCLGVYARSKVQWYIATDGSLMAIDPVFDRERDQNYLTSTLMAQLGLRTNNGEHYTLETEDDYIEVEPDYHLEKRDIMVPKLRNLTTLNDQHHWNFEQIANLIRAHLLAAMRILMDEGKVSAEDVQLAEIPF